MRRSAISAPLLLTAALLAPTMLSGCSSTYGTGKSPGMAMFGEMTGGLLNKGEKKEPIEYQPRAPLVMPPTTDHRDRNGDDRRGTAPAAGGRGVGSFG
jgi:hypothetical protein